MAKSTSNPRGAGRKPLVEKNLRASLFINENLIKAIKYIAFKEDINRTSIINSALTEYVKQWEAKNGPIPKTK